MVPEWALTLGGCHFGIDWIDTFILPKYRPNDKAPPLIINQTHQITIVEEIHSLHLFSSIKSFQPPR